MIAETKLYRLTFAVIDKATGRKVLKHTGTYAGTTLAEAQEDATIDTEEFDPETQVMVFSKQYEEAEV